MHHCLAGMGGKFVELFFDSTQDKEYCLAKYIIELDTQFQSVTLCQSMTRAPKSISDRGSWTCIECRTFLLFLRLPSLKDILPEKYFLNLKDFVISLYILLKDSITQTELDEADERLKRFVPTFNRLYGNLHMVYNIHLCTHLVHMVKKDGSLWATSAFPFKAGNGRLLKLVAGTRGVVT